MAFNGATWRKDQKALPLQFVKNIFVHDSSSFSQMTREKSLDFGVSAPFEIVNTYIEALRTEDVFLELLFPVLDGHILSVNCNWSKSAESQDIDTCESIQGET